MFDRKFIISTIIMMAFDALVDLKRKMNSKTSLSASMFSILIKSTKSTKCIFNMFNI